MPDRPHFFDLDPAQLRELMSGWGMPGFRAEQVRKWVFERGVIDPQQMTDLSKADRVRLAEGMRFTAGQVIRHQSATDGTQKLLIDWGVDEAGKPMTSECVMIPSPNPSGGMRRTACISSQVGCPVGCRFCASGLGGLDLNLTTGQILEQVWHLSQLPGVERISNIVFMGMGEPLSNFGQVVRAVKHLSAPWGFHISGRKITISTVGVPGPIRRLADQLDVPITLALSLHAPNDELRRQLIPWAEGTSVEALLDACRYYFQKTGREITIEYTLLRGVNDRPEHAKQLARLARQLRSNVNLIRYNEVRGLPFNRPESDDVQRFQEVLRKAGVNVHIRASRGRDIAAACGQLRHEQKQQASA